jgi:glycosyltransferase involved in cell wall biosynthesis
MSADRPRVVVLRGTSANPWDLRAWEPLADAFDITVPIAPNNLFDTESVGLRRVAIRTVGGRLQTAGPAGRLALHAVGERYLGLAEVLERADIVHAAELGTWFAAQAAALRGRLGFRLVLTVWETLPFVTAYRNLRTRPYRERVLRETDLFLPTTERARTALLLEGATPDRIRVCPPGVDLDRFAAARTPRPSDGGNHLILSVGRLVWEKGHQDLLRAVALLRHRGRTDLRVLIVGVGPEEERLRRTIADLSLDAVAELRGWVPHDELQDVYSQASCLVLGSEPTWSWEEQFGMVLVEALAAHIPVIAAASGAIPEVLDGNATLFAPGDWVGLADALGSGPLQGHEPPRHAPAAGYLERYSAHAASQRLRAAYDQMLT